MQLARQSAGNGIFRADHSRKNNRQYPGSARERGCTHHAGLLAHSGMRRLTGIASGRLLSVWGLV
jgi:hypothetical protein